MKTGRKLIAVLLAVILTLTAFPLTTYGATSGVFEYELKSDGTIKITGYIGDGGDVVIPDEILGLSVSEIDDFAFAYQDSLTSLVIPDGVSIIGGHAFDNCFSLVSIDIPDSVTIIGDWAFNNCSSLNSVVVPDGVATIGDWAFYNCSSLNSIFIPDSVITIGKWPFYACSSLIEITVAEENMYYSSDAYGALFNKDKTVLIQYPVGNRRTEYVIPDSVTKIESEFSECKSLISIVIPDGMTIINENMFSGCSSLAVIEIPGSLDRIRDYAFNNCDALKLIYFTGSMEQWENITVSSGNETVKNAKIIYGKYPCANGHAVDWSATLSESYLYDFAESISCPRCGLETLRISPPLTPEQTLMDDGTSVVLGFAEDVLPSAAEVKVFRPQSGAAYERLEQEKGAYAHRLFEISATDGEIEIAPDGVVLVEIPVPNGFDANSTDGYIIAADGSTFEPAETIARDGFIWFETDTFPIAFALVDESTSSVPPEEGTTGVPPEEGTTQYPTEPEPSTEPEESAHRYGEWLLVEVATCDTPGKEQRVCEHCGKIETRLVQPLGHDMQVITVLSSCTVAGVIYQICNRCGELSHEFLLPLAPHTMGGWEVVKQPTALEAGREELRCTVCGALLQTREVELLPDADSPVVTTPLHGFVQNIVEFFRRILNWFERLFVFA